MTIRGIRVLASFSFKFIRMLTNSDKETIKLGKDFAKKLKGGEVVLLIGDLGAGKTTFVKGVAQGLGIKKHITSPTFVLLKVYKVKSLKLKVKELIHIDTYRGLDLEGLENIGAVEYFGRKDIVCFVEWGAGLEKFLKKGKIKVYKVKIKNLDTYKRQINI
ncbi:tRNA (adenosine(37)-N6)-threonylcarbamoyltransferase complex ATPase subunit type 1 TsaE [Candidatus Falkowbacteria bacterium]|jgi:tRNA threonylcarbamoyladenosine biosynthesis protein TsaE|nr:tRNA (adenosine(37)-N6)-threonylcarbamoyltransferase complex ATPase subunit type 1 TsaE [Candidatus Falkowbacteria bacterium]MBT6574186.1 tRNA (adenosine(37)-N6)-threonylcarbamoyltransferase complex ATPase subunit type 1 TsaE [Candidatus Falkowbacteria bacterium]MBT7348667.1 tRNA (adenosine(37)-N6)-threonylcarbamoyltransferase complex ATPase subunit type 1 TsaE [Candidatus Falkowbacteria bacterium]